MSSSFNRSSDEVSEEDILFAWAYMSSIMAKVEFCLMYICEVILEFSISDLYFTS